MKGIPSGGTRVEVKELWQEEAILDFKVQNVKLFYKQNYNREFSKQNCSEVTADLGV